MVAPALFHHMHHRSSSACTQQWSCVTASLLSPILTSEEQPAAISQPPPPPPSLPPPPAPPHPPTSQAARSCWWWLTRAPPLCFLKWLIMVQLHHLFLFSMVRDTTTTFVLGSGTAPAPHITDAWVGGAYTRTEWYRDHDYNTNTATTSYQHV